MKSLEFLKDRPIAHRGIWSKEEDIPENSLPAFGRAVLEKYPIELDVHLLKDGTVVVFHDDNLNRMTGFNKKIKDCTYNEIKNLKLKNTNYGIPKFEEVLDLVNGKVPILIEFKYDRKAGETESALMKLIKDYKGKYAVQSFSPKSLIWFKTNYPEVVRGQLASNCKDERMLFIKKFVLRNVYLNFLTKPDFISYAIKSFPNKRIQSLKDKGMLILGWTARTNEDLERAKNNCDNIIGENFNRLDMKIFVKK